MRNWRKMKAKVLVRSKVLELIAENVVSMIRSGNRWRKSDSTTFTTAK